MRSFQDGGAGDRGSGLGSLMSLLGRFDARVAHLAQRTRGTALEGPAHLLSSAADRSKLWLALALLRAAVQGRAGRAAALRVAVVVPTQVVLVELGIKPWARRTRPDTGALPLRFRARRPPSSSFPSGHSASAAAAAILLTEGTSLGAPLGLLALGVAASRLQTGLHHATDVGAGLLLGTAVGLATRRAWPLPHG
ncbi:MAG: phosphatase PAP2 family protein [Candidatus Dormibacteria bacterium]